jgi:hypothetical protein
MMINLITKLTEYDVKSEDLDVYDFNAMISMGWRVTRQPINIGDDEKVICWKQDPQDPWRAISIIGKKTPLNDV